VIRRLLAAFYTLRLFTPSMYIGCILSFLMLV
jgi:hypothetical protein